MQIKRRRLLVALLIVSQLGCLTFGVVWSARWLHGVFDSFIARNVAAQGRLLAYEVERRIAEESVTTVEPGTLGWDLLQQLCEKVDVPHAGFVSIMRSDTGALVCHSKLKEDPRLLRSFPGRLPLVAKQGVTPLVDAVEAAGATASPVVSGKVEIDGQLYAVTSIDLPKLNAVLAICQADASIAMMSEELVNPLLQAGLVLIASVVGATGLLTVFLVRRFESTLMEVNSSLEQEVELRTESLVRTRNAVVFGLAKLSESRDKDTAGHLERLRTYVTILSTEMAKTNPEIDHHYVANLAVASALHDVGKVGLPDAVLLKAGKLTPAERKAMQMHTQLGGECLAAVGRQLGDDDFLELGRQVAMAHHEQWDGSGYPLGLQGRAIPLAARITALADVYDALTSHRPYRSALSHEEAREWILTHYGTQFDPEVVEAFMAREQDFIRLSTAHGASLRPARDGEANAALEEADLVSPPATV